MLQLSRESSKKGKEDTSLSEKDKRIGPFIIREGENIGHGTTGTVKLAFETTTKSLVAVKIVDKTIFRKRKEAKNEIRILQRVEDHKNIIKLKHVEEDSKNIYIFLEYCELGDLYSYIERHGSLDEINARRFFLQILDAVEYFHRKLRVCHHDLKLENCVITSEFELKLIDFGFATEFEDAAGKKPIRIYDGSPAYSAPEILLRCPHDESVDIYSLGTALFFMLCGKFPFCEPGKTTCDELIANITTGGLEFPDPDLISPEVQDLIGKMLVPAAKRIKISEIRSHPWLEYSYSD